MDELIAGENHRVLKFVILNVFVLIILLFWFHCCFYLFIGVPEFFQKIVAFCVGYALISVFCSFVFRLHRRSGSSAREKKKRIVCVIF